MVAELCQRFSGAPGLVRSGRLRHGRRHARIHAKGEARALAIVLDAAARRRPCWEGSDRDDPRIAAVEGGLVRGLAALLGAGAFSLGGVALEAVAESSDDPQSVTDYAAVLAVSAALLGAGTALAFLRRFGARRSRRAGNLGLAVAGVGAALAGVGNAVELGLGVSSFGLLFALGTVALLLGLLIAAVSVLTAPAPWRWAGLALVLLAVGMAVGEEPGFVLVGVTWIVLAALLAARSGPFRPNEIAWSRAKD